ncbi:proteasome maturation protein-like [Centruroides sculpturatus]|uniref:proteasome maturation protein-like n=1 Tax=Centruroides sculpturatus TaxID=218467 RepID=UPI000C6DA4DC|nr:proteasome maturation protein-like [Centruroides sculpturatus]XP_023234344.1 proteasome maturation protein-like [Centruroides sculpturatus]XP_023234345.1 proteasome maturation protein-like [Centruroides sculpturatus]XP_023234346.1 proteasome maturation protein-like [Centruroides sculpturatus]
MELPSLRPRNCGSNVSKVNERGQFGLSDPMIDGFQSVQSNNAEVYSSHPLEKSEKEFGIRRRQMDYAMLKRVQGLHAPLRLEYERKIASKIGRLPFLPSSGFMSNTLDGTNLDLSYEDVLADPSHSEVLEVPLVAIEKRLVIP